MWRSGYFAAWNARDPRGGGGLFAPAATYRDPGVPDGLDPAGTGAYAAGLWTAFPDLAFAVDDLTRTASGCGPQVAR